MKSMPCHIVVTYYDFEEGREEIIRERALLEFNLDELPVCNPIRAVKMKADLTNGRAVVRRIDRAIHPGEYAQVTVEEPADLRKDEIEIDFFEKPNDGWHWVVNGKLREKIADNAGRKICIISQILFDNVGTGRFVPHKTFCNAIGWSEEEYFGKKSEDSGKKLEKGRMNRQLHILRKNVDIEIEFDERGVRFPANVVKSKKRPS